MQKSPRYHHLDALRAIMMILGIVIHSALSYGKKDHSSYWGITDFGSTHVAFDALADLIHLFRMPIFFVIAGFFAAMLYFERGAKAMLNNRVQRILFPFFVGLILLIPLNSLAFIYSQQQMQIYFETPINHTFMSMTVGESISLMHLWFLYYLMILCLIGWCLSNYLTRFYQLQVIQLRKYFQRLLSTGQLFWISIFFTFTSLLWANNTFTKTSLSFLPNLITLFTYAIFFGFGWLLYHNRTYLSWFGERYKTYLYTGLSLCLVRWSIPTLVENHLEFPVFYIKMILAAIIIWLLIYGIIGLFIARFAQHSSKMRYISDASYWIYLIHLPLTAVLPSLFLGVPIPSFLKFLSIVTMTFLITLITYHFFVRSSFIGQFLNGRKHPKSPSPLQSISNTT